MQSLFSGRTVKISRHSRLLLLTLALAATPAQAQFGGWFEAPASNTPAAPQPPVPAADLELWLKNARQAADAARTAQKKGDAAKRTAAIIDTLKWVEKVVDPHTVPDASRLAALEIVGLLARDMNTWKVTFKYEEVGTLLVMNDVRAKSILERVPNAQKAPIQMHLGEIGAAQEYSHVAYDNFSAIALNPEAEIPLVKRAAERVIPYIPGNNQRSARPIYDRMLTLTLTPEERTRWQNLRAVHILNTEYKGEEREAALALIKAQVFNDATPAAIREKLARDFEDAVKGEDTAKLYDAMLARPNLDGPTKAHWLFLRGERHSSDQKFAEAAADYEQAAQVAPANSLQRDEALWSNAWVRLNKLNAKGDVRAAVAPTLANLVNSAHFTKEKRYTISTHLLYHYLDIKDYANAQKLATLRKELADKNLPRQIDTDLEIVQIHLAQNQFETAVALWTAQPYDALMASKPDWGTAKYQTKNNLMRSVSTLYSALIKAKNFELAQKVLDDPETAKIISAGDHQLLRADFAVSKGDYPGALTVLRALLATLHTAQDKATVNAYIAGVEKMQTAPATP